MTDLITDVVVMNCVMVYDKKNDTVLLQNRTKKWCGGCFPGGHLENGESIYSSAVREIFEETGLKISNLVPCGLVHWNKSGGRHELIFCYRTGTFEGSLSQCDEGTNYWVKRTELKDEPLASWFREQLPLFFSNSYTEISHIYDEETDDHPMSVYSMSALPETDSLPEFGFFTENTKQ